MVIITLHLMEEKAATIDTATINPEAFSQFV
jgi:hypothetical protein